MISDENLAQLREMMRELLREEFSKWHIRKKSPDKTVAERMRKYRAKQRKERNVTSSIDRNASLGNPVTLRNGARNGHAVLGDGDLIASIPSLHGLVEVRKTFVMELIEAYPSVLVAQEIDRAKLWLDANPTKRKTNVRRFLTNWVSRCQERGPR